MLFFVARMLRYFWEGLVIFGESTFAVAPSRGEEPADGHPERLCPHVPLTELERALERELASAMRATGQGWESR